MLLVLLKVIAWSRQLTVVYRIQWLDEWSHIWSDNFYITANLKICTFIYCFMKTMQMATPSPTICDKSGREWHYDTISTESIWWNHNAVSFIFIHHLHCTEYSSYIFNGNRHIWPIELIEASVVFLRFQAGSQPSVIWTYCE